MVPLPPPYYDPQGRWRHAGKREESHADQRIGCPGHRRAVESGQVEVLADERSRFVKESLPRDHELIYPPIEEFWDAAVGGTG